MTRASDSSPSSASASADAAQDGHVCPFCGLTREITDDFDPATPCPRCTLADTAATRSATKARIGPWHVRQVRNPWAPGMGFDTLLALVKRGQVTRDSIVRGPTTHQLWKRAGEIKGLSREFGICYSCGGEIGTQANLCPNCNRLQEPPLNPDVLLEGREPGAAPAPPAAARPSTPAPPPTPPRVPAPVEPEEEPANLDIGSSTPSMSSEDMLAADEAAMARQLTSRPPVATPERPPRPLRPRTPGANDALLTPQELAQAFQLGFTPGNKRGGGKSKRLAIVVIILLLGGGTAALLSLRPNARSAASKWMSDTYASAHDWFVARTSTPKAPPPLPKIDSAAIAEKAAASQPHHEPLVIEPPPATAIKTVEVSDAPPAAKVIETPTPVPAPAPAPTPAPAVAEIPIPPPPATSTAPNVPPAPAPNVPKSPVVTTVPAAAPAPELAASAVKEAAAQLPPGDPEEQARTLWRKAIDAEVNQDYVEAVKCYEQIKKLPADVHPWGLDVRLEQARKLVK